MATQVQFRRGTTAQNDAFTGAVGEVTVDTDKDTLRVHDGGTAGGKEIAKADGTNIGSLTYSGSTKLATTSTGIDVTGTVTADAIAVEGASGAQITVTDNSPSNVALFMGAGNSSVSVGSTSSDPVSFLAANTERMRIASNGDISFYEDTGTTAKFFWDASAERLGIGTSSPQITLHTSNADTSAIPSDALANGGFGQLKIHNTSDSAIYSGINFQTRTTASTAGLFGLGYNTTFSDGYFFFRLRNGAGSNIEAMRIDSSGNVMVGTTGGNVSDDASGSGGINLYEGTVRAARNGAQSLDINRIGTDGDIAVFRKDGTTVGSIGVKDGDVTIGNGDTGVVFNAAGDTIIPFNMSTNAGRDAALDLGIAAFRFKNLYLSGGVYVGGTGSANYLDDYEEGTWTPQIYYQNADDQTNSTNVEQVGTYVKVGRSVMLHCHLKWNSNDARANDNIGVKNIPFVSMNLANNIAVCALRVVSASITETYTGSIGSNSSLVHFSTAKNGTGNAGDEFGNNTGMVVQFTITYDAA